jgi:pimeloyl-ACP methyl ester carboxylesterase
VFVHGYDVGPLTYQRFCSNLSSSGYVVAAPSFPLEDPQRGFGLDRGDLPNEATDVSFVISSLEGGALAKEIDPSRIAVVGHSDGADVALMMSDEQATADARVRAVLADAPDPIDATVVPAPTPLLLVQGTADSVVPYTASQTVFSQVEAPTYYVSLTGADHLAPIEGRSPWTPTLDSAAVEFLDATIAGRGPGAGLSGQLASLPLARLQTARLG